MRHIFLRVGDVLESPWPRTTYEPGGSDATNESGRGAERCHVSACKVALDTRRSGRSATERASSTSGDILL
jgi:hypothetical protein